MHLILDRQTGSGKTYSMGTGSDQGKQHQGKRYGISSGKKKKESKLQIEIGIIPRFAHSLFERMLDFQGKGSNNTFQIYASFLEVYNEDIHDLLITTEMNHQQDLPPPTIREDMDGKIYWAGIKEERVYTVEDLMRYY